MYITPMLKYVYLIATVKDQARRERYLSRSGTILIHSWYEIPSSGILYGAIYNI